MRRERTTSVLLGLVLAGASPGSGARAQDAGVATPVTPPAAAYVPLAPQGYGEVPPPPSDERVPPAPAPAPALSPPAPAPSPPAAPPAPSRGFAALGIGGGVWLLTGSGSDGAVLHPSVAIEFRQGTRVAPEMGLELVTDIAVNDFEAIGDAYSWYMIKDEWQFWKFAVLWPGLVLAPLIGSHITTGPGVVIYSAAAPPSFFVDLGFQLSMFLRPTDSKFLFGMGAFAGVGAEITAHASLLLRFVWAPPTFNSWFADVDEHVLSWMGLIEWVR